MTPNEHDNPETSEELRTTELYPFSTGHPQRTASAVANWATDDTVPDVPPMEQLPDPDALPDPRYPVMPASP
jgi:hypothetical protein